MSHHTKRNSKEKNQRFHAKTRMLQHYGISVSYADLEKLAEIFRHDPDTAILHKRSNRLTKAVIAYNGQCYPIVYDHTRHQIVTVLKVEYLMPRQKQIFDSCQFRQQSKQHGDLGKINIPVMEDVSVEGEDSVLVEDVSPAIKSTNIAEDEKIETEDEKLMREAFNRLPN